jgi:hypothetical protein
MIKNASKLLFTIAGLSVVASVLFAAFTSGHKLGMDTLVGPLSLGWKGYVGNHTAYVVLMSVALTALTLGIIVSLLHDGDAATAAEAAGLASVPDAVTPVSTNYWPLVGAFSAGVMVLGLAFGPIVFVLGVVGVLASMFEWTVRAWAERATGDQELNRHLRNTLMFPFEFPAAGVLVLGGIALAMWKIMMALPSVGSIIVFSAVPALILALGAVLVLKPKISPNVVAVALVVGALALVAGGVTAAVVGERDHHTSSHEDGTAPIPSALVETAN